MGKCTKPIHITHLGISELPYQTRAPKNFRSWGWVERTVLRMQTQGEDPHQHERILSLDW